MQRRVCQALFLCALLALVGCGTQSASTSTSTPSTAPTAVSTTMPIPTTAPTMAPNPTPVGIPAPAGPLLYASLSDGTVVALSPSDGTIYWRLHLGGSLSAPVVANGMVYVGSGGQDLYALDALTGTVRWHYQVGQQFTLSAASGEVFAFASNGTLSALNANNASVLWQKNLSGGIDVPPVTDNGVVYVGAGDGLYAFNAQDGSQRWHDKITGGVASDVLLADGVLYALGMDGNFYSINASDGSTHWKIVYGVVATASPLLAVANGVLYLDTETGVAGGPNGGAGGNIEAFSTSNGAMLWKLIPSVFGPLTVSNGTLYVSASNKLLALQSSNGAQRWSVSIAGSSAAWAVNTLVYVGSSDGNVYALKTADGSVSWQSPMGNAVTALTFSQ